MASFSLNEKLAVTGAFLALVALVVGTEDDPGLVVTGQKAVRELRPMAVAAPAPSAPLADVPQTIETRSEIVGPQPSLADSPSPDATSGSAPAPNADAGPKAFDPELGRVPLDFSNGPPPG